ncbi:von Willebrand factor type A [Candidatus Haloredivivus sp. G17]|nr:von Willebrand factor type A [Candidatus Haloredivivus sp. G17]
MADIREEDFFGKDDLTTKVDTEVKKVADTFMFALKYAEEFQASGIEFSDLRQYQTSDDASRIDWKNSASTQDLYVKEYEEEKDMDVFIILDASDSMMFGTADKMKSEYAAIVSAAIAYASTDAGINVGFGIYADNEMTMLPEGGQVQYQKILLEVTNFDNYGGEFNLEHALNSVIGQIKENTAIFIISDFLDAKGDWKVKDAGKPPKSSGM